MIFLATLLVAAAAAEPATRVTVAATGGFDYPTHQAWAGVDLALHPWSAKGVAPLGRVMLGANLFDMRPASRLEAGFAGVIPNEQTILRVGVVGRATLTFADYALPVQVGGEPEPDTFGGFGLIPAGMALVEFDFRPDKPAAIGLRGGVSSVLATMECESPLDDPDGDGECFVWVPGFAGGFQARIVLDNGFFAEIEAGPDPRLGVGFAF